MTGTPLGERIRRLIAANGPLSVADYMALCLGDPQHGYYATRDPLGAAGDFTTAPEVSQMFGEIVGAWLLHMQSLLGLAEVRLAELGPGRGTLMADILRSFRRPGRRPPTSVHLVETSPALRARQRRTLAAHAGLLRWHERIEELPEGPLLVVANEFFDALPVRQFVRAGGAWRERVVGLDAAGRLAFGIGAARLDSPLGGAEGAILELRPAAEAILREIARRIAGRGGAALVIDYGHAETALGDTLQAVRRHAFADPLEAPGEADLTAHVDFAALAAAARAGGAAAHGPMEQGAFLLGLGLAERASQLGARRDEATQATLRAAVARLAGAAEMGRLFKVLAVTPLGVTPPPFAGGV